MGDDDWIGWFVVLLGAAVVGGVLAIAWVLADIRTSWRGCGGCLLVVALVVLGCAGLAYGIDHPPFLFVVLAVAIGFLVAVRRRMRQRPGGRR